MAHFLKKADSMYNSMENTFCMAKLSSLHGFTNEVSVDVLYKWRSWVQSDFTCNPGLTLRSSYFDRQCAHIPEVWDPCACDRSRRRGSCRWRCTTRAARLRPCRFDRRRRAASGTIPCRVLHQCARDICVKILKFRPSISSGKLNVKKSSVKSPLCRARSCKENFPIKIMLT